MSKDNIIRPVEVVEQESETSSPVPEQQMSSPRRPKGKSEASKAAHKPPKKEK